MFIGTTINDSPVITAKTGAKLEGAEFLAVKFSNGKIVNASVAGENCLGILPAEQGDVENNNDVTVQIAQSGLWKTGAAVAAGAELATDANGKAVTATAGQFILAIALEAATAANEVIKVQIVKAYKPNPAN